MGVKTACQRTAHTMTIAEMKAQKPGKTPGLFVVSVNIPVGWCASPRLGPEGGAAAAGVRPARQPEELAGALPP
jgi:hypothetical protein